MMAKHRLQWSALALTALVSGMVARPGASAQPPAKRQVKLTPEAAALFETSVRPVLAESCFGCHGKDEQSAGLRLDRPITAEMARMVVTRVRGEGGKARMPPGQAPLAEAKVKALDAWAAAGAPWPDAAAPSHGGLWSLRRIADPKPPRPKSATLAKWVRTPVDAFVAAGLEKAGLAPAPTADRRTLIRRLSFDLTGLPPTPAEIDTFLSDKRPDAYEQLVERLLASPRYGERQARMWMDIARYADTKGYVFVDDRNYYNAYTYRNWLVDAFNNDLPYDRFVTEQLAADRLELGEDKRPLAALGFLTVGRRFLNNEPDIIGDRIDVTTRGFLGLTVQCARCHDHKFDPVPTQDYYSLYSIFASSQENTPSISPKAITEPWERHNSRVTALSNERDTLIRAQIEALRAKAKADPNALTKAQFEAVQLTAVGNLPTDDRLQRLLPIWPDAERERLASIRRELSDLAGTAPASPEFAMGVVDKPQPVVVNIHKRGNPNNPGDPAPRRFLTCLVEGDRPEWTQDSGRLALARSIASPDNPLTARVFVNRIWLGHFGFGIVRTPSDFGIKGELPTHPELLDHLAWHFSRTDKWSIKQLHRRIVLSNTYRQSSDSTPAARLKDSENRLLSHQNRRRIDMEQMRDALLATAANLDVSKTGGKSEELWAGTPSKRRALYGFVERQNLPLTFKTFDFASPDASSPMRFQTTVPQQALFLLNSPLIVEQAKGLAARKELAGVPDPAGKVRMLYRLAYGRLPDAGELALGAAYLRSSAPAGGSLPAAPSEWSYGWGIASDDGIVEFHGFPAFEEQSWRGGKKLPDPAIGWALLAAGGGHPGDAKHMVIRRWTSPFDGKVDISGRLRHPSEQGDGVRARIVASGSSVLGSWNARHSETPIDVSGVVVRKGQTIDFVVDCRETDSFDNFEWAPVIKRVGASADPQRDARAMFSGPAAPPAPPLGRLERYAQALLMSNEFFFVD